MPTLLLLLGLALGVPAPTIARSDDAGDLPAWIREHVPALLEEHAEAGLAVVLLQDGRVTFCEGFGVADRESGRAVTADTLFNVGSLSKTVAAWVVMHQVDEGAFTLDDAVAPLVDPWPLDQEDGPDRDAVTVAGLLSHTAGVGLPSVPGHDPSETPPTLREELARLVTLDGPAGETWAYSGGGYGLLQLLVREQTGRPFAEVAQETVLQPLGMLSSGFGPPAPGVVARLATPYTVRTGEQPGGEPVPGRVYVLEAAAGFVTSARDLGRFLQAHVAGPADEPPGRGVVSADTLTLMGRPWPPAERYGLGYELPPPLGPHAVLMHTGTNLGWKAHLMVLPSLGEGIAVLANSDGGETLHAVMLRFRDELVARHAPR
jgi:CubicO group peptidase (beta-lactamase class C family)